MAEKKAREAEHEASHDKKGKKKKDYVKKLGAMVQVGYEVEEVPYEDSQGYEWQTTGEQAMAHRQQP